MIRPGDDNYDVVFEYIERRGTVGCIEHGGSVFLWTDMSIGCAMCYREMQATKNLDEELKGLTDGKTG